MSSEFVHLHGHTVYSGNDSMVPVEDVIKKAGSLGMKAVAVTEHGNMYSMVKFLRASDEWNKEHSTNPVKPILGCEFYSTEDRSTDPTGRYHIVVLARTNEGLVNLYQLASDAGFNKISGKTKDYPRTEEAMLFKHAKGLTVLSACIGGIIPKLIQEGRYNDAKAKAQLYAHAFEEFYLEVQPHTIPEQLVVNEALVRIHQETGIPLVITSDFHYLEHSDKAYHDILIQMGYRNPFNVDAHFRTEDEMKLYCAQYGIPTSAITNTGKIADSIQVSPKPTDSRGLMPLFPCPPGYTENTYLHKLSMDAFLVMAKDKQWNDILPRMKRLNYEMEIICSMGFAGYFLILWDWFEWCRKNGILIGKGRGSAAGSLVSYVLKITTIDPVKNGYFFERFLNPERIEFPDVDTDISKLDRPRAIGYLLTKYGSEYVAQIVTFTKLKLKSLIKGAMRVLGLDFNEANDITRALPDVFDGKEASYDYIMEIVNNPEEFIAKIGVRDVNTAQRAAALLEETFRKYPMVFDVVTHLAGCVSATGIHAGGVVVSGKPLSQNLPLTFGSDTAVLPLVQISMEDLDYFNALKIDALGLATLSQIRYAMDMTGLDEAWFDSEDFDDPEVYKMLRDGLTTDVFQMASSNATRMIRDMDVSSFDELTDVNAGNRPGPLSKDKDTGKSMVDLYIENKKSGINTMVHPDIDDVLAPTKGCMWYQEQLMAIGQILAGYSLGNADLRIRKVLGKKKIKEIPAIEAEFLYGKQYDMDSHCMVDKPSKYCKGLISRGYDEAMGKKIFASMADFAKYCFNKAHSGAYAAIAYKTAWLKKYHPVEWTVACLMIHDKTEKIVATISDAKKMGIQILPPDINKSDVSFSIELLPDGTKAIRYGLQAVKGVGERTVELIKKLRPFVSFDDFYNRCHAIPREINPETGKLMNNPLTKSNETAMIQAGAFDQFEQNRYKMLNHYLGTIRKEKDFTPYDPKQYVRKVKLAFELDLMGLYVSEHPLDPFPYSDPNDANDGEDICLAGILKTVTVKKNNAGNEYASMKMEVKGGKLLNVVAQTKTYEKYKNYLVQGDIVIVDGSVNKQWDNILAWKIRKIVRSASTKSSSPAALDLPVRDSEQLDEDMMPGVANPLDLLFSQA